MERRCRKRLAPSRAPRHPEQNGHNFSSAAAQRPGRTAVFVPLHDFYRSQKAKHFANEMIEIIA